MTRMPGTCDAPAGNAASGVKESWYGARPPLTEEVLM